MRIYLQFLTSACHFFGKQFAVNSYKLITMAKYSEKAGEKVEKTMHEMKEGKLKSGSGKKVTSKKQAVAIGLSEARKEGAKVPKKKD
jgi:flagellin-like hook-associated protein FlgL